MRSILQPEQTHNNTIDLSLSQRDLKIKRWDVIHEKLKTSLKSQPVL